MGVPVGGSSWPVAESCSLKSGTFKARGASVSSVCRWETESQHERAGPLLT